MMRSLRLSRIARAFVLLVLLSVSTTEAQLYKKTAPPGSTFVRLCNGTAEAGVGGKVGEHAEAGLPPYSAGAYEFMPPGSLVVQMAGNQQSYSFDADHFYTIAHTADGLKLFDLKGFENPLKAMVVIFNLLPDATLSLKTADGKTSVFDNVEAYKSAQREINPLTVKLALFKGDVKLSDVPQITFVRGKVSNLIVGGTAQVPVATWNDQE